MKLTQKASWLLFFIILFSLTTADVGVQAASLNMQVTVGNSAPTLAGTSTSPATSTASPINAGNNLSFLGTGTDLNGDNYYLLICSTASVTPNNGGAPACNGGTQFCVSASTVSGVQASCIYTTLAANPESNAWFAVACDANSTQLCSAFTSSATFFVNHRPTYTVLATGGSAAPGAAVTFTLAGTSWGDTDVTGTADQGQLVICGAAGVTGTSCNSLPFCTSALTNTGSPMSCNYTLPIPSAVGAANAFGYVFDNHGFAAATGGGSQQNLAISYTVTNVAPVMSAISFNNDGGAISTNILPVAGTTTTKTINMTVSDNNGCANINSDTVVVGKTYHNGSGFTNGTCTSTNESCITGANMSCARGGGNTCTGGADLSVSFICTATIQYYNDPTDVGSKWAADNWEYSGIATDLNSAASTAGTTTTECLSLNAHTPASGSVNYGTLSPGVATTTNQAATLTNRGNIGQDITVAATRCTDAINALGTGVFPACGANVMVEGQQHYSAANGTAWASGTALTNVATVFSATTHVLKPTLASSSPTGSVWWGISIPGGQQQGIYTGITTQATIMSAIGNW